MCENSIFRSQKESFGRDRKKRSFGRDFLLEVFGFQDVLETTQGLNRKKSNVFCYLIQILLKGVKKPRAWFPTTKLLNSIFSVHREARYRVMYLILTAFSSSIQWFHLFCMHICEMLMILGDFLLTFYTPSAHWRERLPRCRRNRRENRGPLVTSARIHVYWRYILK